MGRNDLCFCGSGKKQKKCHPEIEETSMAANLLKLYSKLDTKVNEHYLETGHTYRCEKGCAECCYMQTRISEIEYNLIQYELLKWSESELEDLSVRVKQLWNTLNEKHPELIKQLRTVNNGQKVNIAIENETILDAKDIECPFLDLSTNSCLIYNVRPLICRLFGVTFNNLEPDDFILCSKLNITELRKFGYYGKEEFQKEVNNLWTWENKGRVIHKRPLPINYHLYKSFYEGKENIAYIGNFEGKFKEAESTYKQTMFDYVYKNR